MRHFVALVLFGICSLFSGPALAASLDDPEFVKTLQARIQDSGQWTFLMQAPPKLFVTDGYAVLYDKKSVKKLNENQYLVNLAPVETKSYKLWDSRLKAGTYQVSCSERSFHHYGWIGDGMNEVLPKKSKAIEIKNAYFPLYKITCLSGQE